MLIAFGIGVGSLPLMPALAAVMLAATAAPGGQRIPRPAGGGPVAGGLLIVGGR